MNLKNTLFVFCTLLFSLEIIAAPNKIFLKIADSDKEFYKENIGKLAIDIPLVNIRTRHQFIAPEVGTQDTPYQQAEMETRGQGCLIVFRKCLGIDLKDSITFNGQKFKKFDLVSMREDKGYTDTHLGMNIFSYLGMFPLKFDYVELLINNANWGLYTIVETPNSYFKKELKTPFSGRANGIFYKFKSRFYNEKIAKNPEVEFVSDLKSLVKIASKNHSHKGGDKLYKMLKWKMDIDGYLTLLGVHNLLQNGDYSDEIYFYVDPEKYAQGKIYFKVMIWDTDVLFSRPHPTPYNMFWKSRINRTLFYSMENKFDRKLALDKYINKKMAALLKDVLLTKLTSVKLSEMVQVVRAKISPYLTENALRASIYDFNPKERNIPYSAQEIINMLSSKEKLLLQRRNELLKRIDLILKAN